MAHRLKHFVRNCPIYIYIYIYIYIVIFTRHGWRCPCLHYHHHPYHHHYGMNQIKIFRGIYVYIYIYIYIYAIYTRNVYVFDNGCTADSCTADSCTADTQAAFARTFFVVTKILKKIHSVSEANWFLLQVNLSDFTWRRKQVFFPKPVHCFENFCVDGKKHF